MTKTELAGARRAIMPIARPIWTAAQMTARIAELERLAQRLLAWGEAGGGIENESEQLALFNEGEAANDAVRR